MLTSSSIKFANSLAKGLRKLAGEELKKVTATVCFSVDVEVEVDPELSDEDIKAEVIGQAENEVFKEGEDTDVKVVKSSVKAIVDVEEVKETKEEKVEEKVEEKKDEPKSEDK